MCWFFLLEIRIMGISGNFCTESFEWIVDMKIVVNVADFSWVILLDPNCPDTSILTLADTLRSYYVDSFCQQ